MPDKLTMKQALFVDNYLANGGNGTRAAESAGYKGNSYTLKQVASENLAKPYISAYIRAKTAKIEAEQGLKILSRLQIHEKVCNIAIDPQANNADRLRALELAGKPYAMWIDSSIDLSDRAEQKALTEAESLELKRIVTIRLAEMRAG